MIRPTCTSPRPTSRPSGARRVKVIDWPTPVAPPLGGWPVLGPVRPNRRADPDRRSGTGWADRSSPQTPCTTGLWMISASIIASYPRAKFAIWQATSSRRHTYSQSSGSSIFCLGRFFLFIAGSGKIRGVGASMRHVWDLTIPGGAITVGWAFITAVTRKTRIRPVPLRPRFQDLYEK